VSMSKMSRFKEYDKLFSPQPSSVAERDAAISIRCWEHKVLAHTMQEVLYAVYEAPDFLEWQKFRVGLKGCSTRVKLFRLSAYLHDARISKELRQTRVDNYIGALKRSGHLSSDGAYKIMKAQ
jgi:hypothetical protein